MERASARNKLIAAETRASIDAFETTMKGRVAMEPSQEEIGPFSDSQAGGETQKVTQTGRMVGWRWQWFVFNSNSVCVHIQAVTAGPTTDYVSQIKRRVQDDSEAREEREKRRRKVIMDQMRALQQQEVSVDIEMHTSKDSITQMNVPVLHRKKSVKRC